MAVVDEANSGQQTVDSGEALTPGPSPAAAGEGRTSSAQKRGGGPPVGSGQDKPQGERSEALTPGPSSTADRSPAAAGEGSTPSPPAPLPAAQAPRPAPGEGRTTPRKRGGGPKTAAGKAVVARNPIKHGVLAQTPVLPLVEREEDWLELRRDVFEFFELEGPLLESLGDRAAMIIWRLYRAARFETESIQQYLEDVPGDWYSSMKLAGKRAPRPPAKADVEEMNRMLMARLLPGDEIMAKVMRYETKLHRYLLQTLYMIMVLKGLKRSPTSRFFGVAELNPPGVSAKNSPPGFQGDGGG